MKLGLRQSVGLRLQYKGHKDHHSYYVTDRNPRTSHNELVTLEFIRNQITKEDNWYILNQPKGSCHWYTNDSRKLRVNNSISLGW